MKKKQNNKHYSQKGFFETLKDLGGDVVRSAEDLVKGTAEETVSQITGHQGVLRPEEPLELEKYLAEKEKVIRTEERRAFEQRRAQERMAGRAEQQKTVLQIKAIQEELKNLVANDIEGLSREIKTAAIQAIVEPGVYHFNFLGKLRQLISLIRKKVQESKTWLAEWNSYCKKKRNFYWAQVKQSGTKFMLSSERYMATQAG